MSGNPSSAYERPHAAELARRLEAPRRHIQVVAGPRQVGKTTLVLQALRRLGLPHHYASADEPTLRGERWLASEWETARAAGAAILVVDEVQKASGWAETVKRSWDDDSRAGRDLRVVLLGSAPLLVQQGLTESLAGRFEVLHVPHWSFTEMRTAFGFTLEQHAWFGGYPGAAPLASDAARWRRYVLDSLVETTLSRDVLLMTRVDKPALLRRLFELGCRHSGQVLSYTKMLGQLQDAGNVTTLAHYLELLEGAGLLRGLQKHAGDAARRRGSSPKLQVLDTALMTAASGDDPDDWLSDPEARGRLMESVVGAHLANGAFEGGFGLHYWLDRGREVDFVLSRGRRLVAIEVKTGRARAARSGLDAFAATFPNARTLLVGTGGIGLEEFLGRPAESWLAA